MVKTLTNRIGERSVELFGSGAVMRSEFEQELEMVSESARNHLDEIRQEATHFSLMFWATQHVLHEIYAGVANLKTIQKRCRVGQLATMELAELIEHPALAQVPDERTRIFNMIVVEDGFEVTYSIIRWLEIINELLVEIGFGTGLVITIGVILYLIFKQTKITKAISWAETNFRIKRVKEDFSLDI